ncbi:NAD(P)/FAD-dependent oxidoreductase [Streptomyces sp. NPDC102384]|uniref:NAD(P)/FAD-dependent oxidoreductase n=1 Tax=Streptomyces sp. NPDC102384 TaxID=3366166 RepID=UPI00380E2677
MPTNNGIAIVGAGLAAAKTVEALRLTHGYEGPLTLIGDEPHLPYERPGLSKGYLLGTVDAAGLDVHPADFYAANDISLLRCERATDLDLAARRVRTDAGTEVAFDQVVLATGARARRLDVAGRGLAGIHYLRNRDDSDRLREALGSAGSVVIVGAGWIGLELASAARTLGLTTTVIEPLPTPLYTVLGPEIGGFFAQRHRDHGVNLRTGDGVEKFLGTGRVEAVRTTTGKTIPADLVIVGIGAIPNTELAEQAGLKTDAGILVDPDLRTSHPAALATGDVARQRHPRHLNPIRVDHWDNAIVHGTAAAATLTGVPKIVDMVPYFFSTQYDSTLEYVGHPLHWDRVITRGAPDAPGFTAFWLDGGTPVAAMTLDNWGAAEHLRALVAATRPTDTGRLGDPGVPLPDLARAAA